MANEERKKEEESYIEQMRLWIGEQEIIENQIKRAAESYSKLAESNRKQLVLHQERINIVKCSFEDWKIDNGIN